MENAAQPIVVKTGGGSGTTLAVGAIALALLGYGGYKFYQQSQKNSAEANADTPEGIIAFQLKTVFDKFPVSDKEFRSVWLQVNSTNKDAIMKIYRQSTGRNLSDDIASHINTGDQQAANKIEKYNSKPGRLFSVAADASIKFEVKPGDQIRFAPGQTTPIMAYTSHLGIVLKEVESMPGGKAVVDALRKNPKTAAGTVSVQLSPSARLFKVTGIKEVPLDGYKSNAEWTKYIAPFIKTRKVFAMVQILLGTDPKSKKQVYGWIDARDMVTFKQTIKGLGAVQLLNLVS